MKKSFVFLFVCLMFTCTVFSASGDEIGKRKVSIVGKDMKISAIFGILSKKFGLNYVLPKKYDYAVNLSLKDASLNAAVKSITKSVGLKVKIISGIYYISKPVHHMKGKKKKCMMMQQHIMKKCFMRGMKCKKKKQSCKRKCSTMKSKRCDYKGKCGSGKKMKKAMFNRKKTRRQKLMFTSTPMTEYVTIDVKSYDVKKLFDMIQKISGKKIMVNPRVNGYVDYNVKGKYYKDAVKEICDMIGARVIENDSYLTVIE